MPGVVRQGDLCTGHPLAEPRPPIQYSTNVFCNGKPVVRAGDLWQLHGVPPHTGFVTEGAPNVFVNGRRLARIGDAINCGSFCAQGSTDVFCGNG